MLTDDTETGTCTTPETTCRSFSGHDVVSSSVHAFSVPKLSSATASMAQEKRQSEFHPSVVDTAACLCFVCFFGVLPGWFVFVVAHECIVVVRYTQLEIEGKGRRRKRSWLHKRKKSKLKRLCTHTTTHHPHHLPSPPVPSFSLCMSLLVSVCFPV